MTTVKTLQQQNESLQSEINELRYANLAMAEIYAENQRLREMLNYKNAHPEQRLVVSKVLGRTPGELSDSLYIDKGTDDGVQQDMAVVTVNGLVGLVEEAYPSSARVTLVTSTRCNVGARILRANSRAVGIVTGRGGNNVPLLMEHLQREADVLPGDVVVTSGYSQNHPAGIVIGTVKESSLDAAGLLRNATVEPAAVREGLEEVFVVVWHQQDGNVK
ncbi:cell shape-determining protein MreC [Phascolarctobacterium sp. CAG:266]|nr:cell shape-determining protein MreC [Phascolarctobacterium sp. CAG:266]